MVYIDGIYEGYTSAEVLTIAITTNEDHLVRLVKYKYCVCSDTVSVGYGQVITRHYDLIPEDTTGVK